MVPSKHKAYSSMTNSHQTSEVMNEMSDTKTTEGGSDANAFHFNSTPLGPGSVILPGNWGRIVQLRGAQHPEWKREQILEQMRQVEFPSLPSRLQCVFFFPSKVAAETYRATLRNSFHLMYEVELVDPNAPQHEADWKGTGPYQSDGEWARRYWRGDVMPDRQGLPGGLSREMLAVSPLRIIRPIG
jgi:hypothetical protein